jgi:hypothetical protein
VLTIFTTAKPFQGHAAVIQAKAIQSWTLLRPECEIILFDDAEGTAEVADKFGIRHIAEVERNKYGTPLVSSIFKIAQDIASYPLMCYVNADIILMSDFLQAIRGIQKQSFLLVGQRWDLDLKESWDFSKSDWEARLRTYVTESGTLHGPSGIDYFVFPRGIYRDIPPFAIGRPAWDNWMIYRARSMKVPVIDATKTVMVIHQSHDYSHIPVGQSEGKWGPETKRNREIIGGSQYVFTLDHASLLLTPQGLQQPLTIRHLYFRLESLSALVPHLHFLRFLGITRRNLMSFLKIIRAMLGRIKDRSSR